MIYLRYFVWLLLHKWYVFIECCRLGVFWRGLLHDLSSFCIREFKGEAYRRFGGNINDIVSWNRHIHLNPHHWQYWVYLRSVVSQGMVGVDVLDMPEVYVREMLADWVVLSRDSKIDFISWYNSNRYNILLSKRVRDLLDILIEMYYNNGVGL